VLEKEPVPGDGSASGASESKVYVSVTTIGSTMIGPDCSLPTVEISKVIGTASAAEA
jgi:hypothetical protein